MKHPLAHSLDVFMEAFILYIHCTLHSIPLRLDFGKEFNKLVRIGCLPGRPIVKPQSGEGDQQIMTSGCQCPNEHMQGETIQRQLYTELRDVFSKVILPTHSLGHVQFIMFYIISVRPKLANSFIEYLRVKYFNNASSAMDCRKNAMAYIGSLLARGNFIPFTLVHSCLQVISEWCHSYIDSQAKQYTHNFMSRQHHMPFYVACQTIFYVFSFRFREYTKNNATLEYARNLNLERLVLCKLNPLAVCKTGIVNNFAAVTQHFQLVYCYAIIESNNRNTLPVSTDVGDGRIMAMSMGNSAIDVFFPFDPYELIGSTKYISPCYREFEELPSEIKTEMESPKFVKQNSGVKAEDGEDDFLDANCSRTSSKFFETQFVSD